MNGSSLRLRLLGGASLAIFVTLAVAWFGMSFLFERHLERRLAAEMRRDAVRLIADLHLDAEGVPIISNMPIDPRYERPTSGLYWQVSTREATRRSRSLWDIQLPDTGRAEAQSWNVSAAQGPFGQKLLMLERLVKPDGADRFVLVQVASNDTEIRDALTQFGREIALFLLLLWLTLSAAAWLHVHLGLIPLKRLRLEVHEMRRNPSNRLGEGHPKEVELLVTAINDLASSREADLRRARQRAADLAHGMKTPLSVLAAQSRLIKSGGTDPEKAAEGMDRAIAWAGAAVEAELARSRAAASRAMRQSGTSTRVREASLRLIGVLERTEKGMCLDFNVMVSDDITAPVSLEDFSEILGPVLENAVRFARRDVRLSGSQTADRVILTIEDDGPGIPEDDIPSALKRGRRFDEAGHGHGLGLAIAQELIDASGGRIDLSVASTGGLSVRLSWVRENTELSGEPALRRPIQASSLEK